MLLLLAPLAGCSTHWRAQYVRPAAYGDLQPTDDFLKAHHADGSVVVLESWSADRERRVLRGYGVRYDAARSAQVTGDWEVPFDDVVLVETTQPESVANSGLIVLGVLTGVSLVASAICLSNPKACFGSCPTFYAEPGGPILAEGFSSSIARTLEATDVDALPRSLGAGRSEVSVWMKNEALETHVVRSVRLLAVPVAEGERVLRSGETWRQVRWLAAPRSCRAAGEACTASVASADDAREYRSLTDPGDLSATETLELEFDVPAAGDLGVVVRARSSLVETFAFYQLMAYLGLQADDWFLQLERAGRAGADIVESVVGRLGRIEAEVLTTRGWRRAGTFREVGPLAFDEVVLPVEGELPAGPVRVRLTLAKGAWKVDHVGLAALGAPVAAVPLEPSAVSRRGAVDPGVTAALRERRAPLVTLPGDAWRFDFTLPPGPQQLFLESRGYYYEWQRTAWLGEESAVDFIDALSDPDAWFRRIAPAYKRIEGDIEALFWNSRVEAR